MQRSMGRTAAVGLVLALSLGVAEGATFKKYEVKSGKVTYRIDGGMKANGLSQSIRGKKRLIFDQYGFRELEEEATVSTTEVMGQKQVDKSHRLNFRNGTKVKVADFTTKSVVEMEAPGLALMVKAAKNNLTQMGEQFLRSMGGQKTGTKKIAGYTCDLWKLPGVTQCLYKGVPLEVVTQAGGMSRKEVAVKAEFDVPVTAADYKLPDFQPQNLPPQAQEMMAAMAGLGEAMAAQGGGNAPSAGSSRGGMFESLKAQSLQQLGLMRELNACLKKSDTIREANACGRSFSQKAGTPFEPIERWDDGIKKEATQNLEEILKVESCIRAAKTMDELTRCNE
jgi:hypothetical protein